MTVIVYERTIKWIECLLAYSNIFAVRKYTRITIIKQLVTPIVIMSENRAHDAFEIRSRRTVRFREYLFGRPKSHEIFEFDSSENYKFLWRNIALEFCNKRTYYFLLFSEGQICRLEYKIRSTSIFGEHLPVK